MSQVGKRLGDDYSIPLQNDQDLCKNARKSYHKKCIETFYITTTTTKMYTDLKVIALLSY